MDNRDQASDSARPAAKARAAMLWAACGDALGWPVEPRGQRVGGTASLEPRLSFIEWSRREGGAHAPFQRLVPAGAYSDDTQLMLAVARSVRRGDAWREHLTQFELAAWPLYEMGGGGAVKSAAQGWAKGEAPWERKRDADRHRYFRAGANGVAMRILPHVIHGAGDNRFDAISERIVADGLTTHGHPRALVGALSAGYAMWSALRWKGRVGYGEMIDDCLGERRAWSRLPDHAFPADWEAAASRSLEGSYEKLWSRTCDEMEGLLIRCREAIDRGSIVRDGEVLEDLGAFGQEGGAGTRTAAVAIYFSSRYAARPAAGMLAAAFARKSDTDTIACVTGAILGAFTGDDRVEGLAPGLLDAEYIYRLADQIAAGDVDDRERIRWPSKMKRKVLGELGELQPGGAISLPLFGDSTVSAVERPESRSANEVTIWWLSTELGQTLPVTRIRKLTAGERASSDDGKRASSQLMIEPAVEAPAPAARAVSAWTFLFVRDLGESLKLYERILGIGVKRTRDRSVVLEGHLILELSDQDHPPAGARLRAPSIIGVHVQSEALRPLRERVANAGYEVSVIEPGRNGDRFRICDDDRHIVEVFTSHPSH